MQAHLQYKTDKHDFFPYGFLPYFIESLYLKITWIIPWTLIYL